MGTWNGFTFGGGSGSAGAPTGTVPASKLFYAAMRKAGIILGPQRGPSPDQYQDALEESNRMLGTWNCTLPNIYTVRIDLFALTNAKSYTIGIDPSGLVTADFDSPRPQHISQANLLFPTAPTIRIPVRILTDLEWSEIVLQDITGTPAHGLYNDGAYPFSTLYLWPQAPAGYSLELYSWQAIPKFATIDDRVLLPDGYEDAIVLNLACRLGPHFQKGEVSPTVQRDAARALAAIASKNSDNPPRVISDFPRGRGNGRGRGSGWNWMLGS